LNLVLNNPVVIQAMTVGLMSCCVTTLYATTLADPTAAATAAVAPPSDPVAPLSDRTTVEELLRLDTQFAINAARRKVFGVKEGDLSALALASHPTVQAIYGTGRTLTAEVLIDGRVHTFKSASRKSTAGTVSGYALERIAPPCIYLTKEQNQEVFCMDVTRP
jgi:hypothetical protein